MLATLSQLISQFFKKKSTNVFPCKYTPASIVDFIKKGEIHPNTPLPDGFRGTIGYDFDGCIGCVLCEKVCPAKAVESYPAVIAEKKTKRVVFYLGRCTSCQECVNICPKKVIWMEKSFMNANYDKYGDSQVIGSQQRKTHEVKTS